MNWNESVDIAQGVSKGVQKVIDAEGYGFYHCLTKK